MAGEDLRTTKRKQRVGVEGIAREKRKPARVKASFRGFSWPIKGSQFPQKKVETTDASAHIQTHSGEYRGET